MGGWSLFYPEAGQMPSGFRFRLPCVCRSREILTLSLRPSFSPAEPPDSAL